MAGWFSERLTVRDSTGASLATLAVVDVIPSLQAESLSAEPYPVEQGRSTIFSIGVVGGVPPFVTRATGLPLACAPAPNVSSWTCTPPEPGEFPTVLEVTDGAGVQVNSTFSLSVLDSLKVRLIALPMPPYSSEVELSASISGGSGPFTYEYLGLPPGCSAPSAGKVYCNSDAPGEYHVEVDVTDSIDGVNSSATEVSVGPGLGAVTLPAVLVAAGGAFGICVLARGRR
ncbi:MAG TPA: hypothetical protein VFG07_08985 [Thermoplasmata archaeon]|nr:hypothetical protein [Thermoplasmata archaeon]